MMRPWTELRTSGLLWLINTSVLHPRGYALGVAEDGSGWRLLGDGSEPWAMPTNDPECDERFAAINELLRPPS